MFRLLLIVNILLFSFIRLGYEIDFIHVVILNSKC